MSRQVIVITEPDFPGGGLWVLVVALFLLYLYAQSESQPLSPRPAVSKVPAKQSVEYKRMTAAQLDQLNRGGQYPVYLEDCKVTAVDTLKYDYRLVLKTPGDDPYYILIYTRSSHPQYGETTNAWGKLIFEKSQTNSRSVQLLNAQFE